MNKLLEKQLIEAFPDYFVDMYGDKRKTCMAFGCACDKGWFGLLCETCNKIKQLEPKGFKFTQIKEKFAALTIYFTCEDKYDEVNKVIDDAYKKSLKICEECGSQQDVTIDGKFWIKTLCKACRNGKCN